MMMVWKENVKGGDDDGSEMNWRSGAYLYVRRVHTTGRKGGIVS